MLCAEGPGHRACIWLQRVVADSCRFSACTQYEVSAQSCSHGPCQPRFPVQEQRGLFFHRKRAECVGNQGIIMNLIPFFSGLKSLLVSFESVYFCRPTVAYDCLKHLIFGRAWHRHLPIPWTQFITYGKVTNLLGQALRGIDTASFRRMGYYNRQLW